MAENSSRERIRAALEANDLSNIIRQYGNKASLLNILTRLSYNKDTLAGWRAIKAMGLVARERVSKDIASLKETCRKLLWSLSDESGGIGWSAPEILGEIVNADPERFREFVPLIASVFEAAEDVFRPGVLYALARVGEKTPDLLLPHKDIVFRGLSEKDPLARIHALNALKYLASCLEAPLLADACRLMQSLSTDTAEAWVYMGDDFAPVEVGRHAQEISAMICDAKQQSPG